MSRPAHDLTGQRFGRLVATTAIANEPGKGKSRWACLCDCGGSHTATASNLKAGKVRSCGCLQSESARERQLARHALDRAKARWRRDHAI